MVKEVKVTAEGVVNNIKAQFVAHPIRTVSALIAVPTALVVLIMQGFALYEKVESYVDKSFVSPQQLKDSEDRITSTFHDEAIVIRGVYIADLTEQVTKLGELVRKSEREGEIKYYTIQIDALNKKIDTLRGTK